MGRTVPGLCRELAWMHMGWGRGALGDVRSGLWAVLWSRQFQAQSSWGLTSNPDAESMLVTGVLCSC